MGSFGDINNNLAAMWQDAIDKQLNAVNLLLPKSDEPPLHGPPEPRLLVRDLIKRLSACNPDARVMTLDYEHGPEYVYKVKVHEFNDEMVVEVT